MKPKSLTKLIEKESDLGKQIDCLSFEQILEFKISRFFEQISDYYPEDLHELFVAKVEKVLIREVMKRVGGSQIQASKILGINRNTLRKKIQLYQLK